MRQAYTAIVNQEGYSIGLADENVNGYTPQPQFGKFPSYEAAGDKARELNNELGLSNEDVAKIVLSSMRGSW